MSTPLRILLVEDEFITMDALRMSLEGMGYAIAGDAMRADEALEILAAGQTDLAILDINIKGENSGIWLAERIRERYDIPFIFLTALADKQTIADAARTQPNSYLLKPFVEQDLYAAIELAINTYSSREVALPTPPAALPPTAPATAQKQLLMQDSIFVKDDLVFQRIAVSDIQYIQSYRNYLELKIGMGKNHILRSTLKDFMARLPSDVFIQTHRSYAVNLQRVNRIGGNFIGVDDHEVPVSREMRTEVFRRLNTYQ
ncbi:MAG: response regulator [Bacteroidota bacterium]